MTTQISTSKQKETDFSSRMLLLNALNLSVPSCNKCCEACNGCKLKFFNNLENQK